jgi:O-antigen/teichoic acid export membrane protein
MPDDITLRASWSTLANLIGFAGRFVCQALVIRLLAPHLGADIYGLLITIQVIASAALALDFGIGIALKNRLVSIGGHNKQEQDILISSSFWLLSGWCAVLIILSAVIVGCVPIGTFVHLNDESSASLASTLLISYFALSLLSIPTGLCRAVLSAAQREYRMVSWTLIGSGVGLLLTHMAIISECSQVYSCIAMPIGISLGNLAAWSVIGFPRFRCDFSALWQLWSDALPFFMIQISMIGISSAPNYIANQMFGNHMAGVYGVHSQIFIWLGMGVGQIASPYWSGLRNEFLEQNMIKLRRRIFWLIGLVGGIALVMVVLAVSFGSYIILLLTNDVYSWDPMLGLILGALCLLNAFLSVGSTALGAFGISRGPSIIIVFQAVITPICAVAGAKIEGPTGLAMGCLLAYILTSGWYVPSRLAKALRHSVRPL